MALTLTHAAGPPSCTIHSFQLTPPQPVYGQSVTAALAPPSLIFAGLSSAYAKPSAVALTNSGQSDIALKVTDPDIALTVTDPDIGMPAQGVAAPPTCVSSTCGPTVACSDPSQACTEYMRAMYCCVVLPY
jgi:hypothetical protein